MPWQIDAGTTHTVEVETITDGDTIDVRFADGSKEELRIIGVDTPETKRNRRSERIQEWEGIEDAQTLIEWGERGKAFARERLTGATVTISFDPSEPVRDDFNRLLVYLEYDAEGKTIFYNHELLAEGYARVYDAGVTNHDAFRAAERDARQADRGLWTESDPDASTSIRNRGVDHLFVPRPTSIRTENGRLPLTRVPVRASRTATQELRAADAVSYADDQIPLVGIDRDARIGLIGGLVINEQYEQAEKFPVDTTAYEPFVFLTNLFTWLADRDGAVLIDGGHGQFGVSYALSSEDAAYYQRYLEGQGIAFEQHNRLSMEFLESGRALIITPPVGRIGDAELDRIRDFRDDGGAVILMCSGAAPRYARRHLNLVADQLGTDVRANADRVHDERHNLDDKPKLPTTSQFDRTMPLFGAYADGVREACLDVAEVNADPEGEDWDTLANETVTLVNRGEHVLDLSGWVLQDLAEKTYTFPDGFELGAGDTVTVHTGEGTDTVSDLFWDAGRPVWNNRGDTIIVADSEGSEALRVSY